VRIDKGTPPLPSGMNVQKRGPRKKNQGLKNGGAKKRGPDMDTGVSRETAEDSKRGRNREKQSGEKKSGPGRWGGRRSRCGREEEELRVQVAKSLVVVGLNEKQGGVGDAWRINLAGGRGRGVTGPETQKTDVKNRGGSASLRFSKNAPGDGLGETRKEGYSKSKVRDEGRSEWEKKRPRKERGQ